jgi:hypothetical protein
VDTAEELEMWSMWVSIACSVVGVGVYLGFQSRPASAPSAAAEGKLGAGAEGYSLQDVQALVKSNGFLHACLGFTVAESLENVYSTYLNR